MTRTERVHFEGANGDRLAARLEHPAGPPVAGALFAHCFTCSKDFKAVVRISRALAERGIAVLRFDFTGLGESEGDFADTTFSSNLEDLVAAARFMEGRYGGVEILIGHSLGGAAVLAVARRIESARAVATIGAPSDTGHLSETILRQAPELASQEQAEVNIAGRSFRIRRQLIDDLNEHTLRECIAELGRPLLILHSPVDEVVGIGHARRIYEAARHPKSLVALDGADHLLLEREEDSRFVAGLLALWAGRYVEAGDAAVDERTDHGEVLVRGGASGYATEIEAGRHRLRADEPESVGGTDTGPDPYGHLLASLGVCKSMTLRMYADRKGWPLEGTEIRLKHSKIHAEDCEECETEQGMVDRIEVEVGVEGPLTEEQRGRLLEISERCPVHRTITSEVSIWSRLAES